jgi:hypothetical protein
VSQEKQKNTVFFSLKPQHSQLFQKPKSLKTTIDHQRHRPAGDRPPIWLAMADDEDAPRSRSYSRWGYGLSLE